MNKPKIIVEENYIREWEAIDDNTYDGHGSPIGRGKTKAEAVEELYDELIDRGLYTSAEILAAAEAPQPNTRREG